MKIYSYGYFVILSLTLVYNDGKSLHNQRKILDWKKRINKNHLTKVNGLNSTSSTKSEAPKQNSTMKNEAKLASNNTLKKHKKASKGGRKSTIDIHENLARTPVIYNSPDGKDYYVFVKTKSAQQPALINTPVPQSATASQVVPHLPSKTFLVTVYGEQLNGAEEKIREALTTPLATTPKPCSCPCCQCACKSPETLHNYDCSCQKPSQCPCEEKQESSENSSPHNAMALFFPNTGHNGQSCACPCCMCSCAKPGLENYNCGCQNSPPAPCPCSTNNYSPQSTAVGYSDSTTYPSSSYCACANQPGCPCDSGASPSQVGTNFARSSSGSSGSPSSVYHVGPYDVQTSCDCHCCPCSCPVTFSSGQVHCECTPERDESCTCRRAKLNKGLQHSKKNI